MCVVSMVMDHFEPIVPSDWNPNGILPSGITVSTWPPERHVDAAAVESLKAEIVRLTQVVEDFKTAVDAARKVDALTAQPDCEDPEKAKLEARVAELERRLDAVSKVLGA